MRDCYEVLGVPRDASTADIKAAFRRLAHRYHPDTHPGAGNEEAFKEVAAAYKILGDPARRQRYDRVGSTGFNPGDFVQGVSDVFYDLFGAYFGPRRRKSGRAGEARTLTLEVDLLTAARGGPRVLSTLQAERCGDCAGSGAAADSHPEACGACGGSGEVRVQQGLLSLRKRCTVCHGRGQTIAVPCPTCAGGGWHEVEGPLAVEVPAGADDGHILRFAERGGLGHDGGAPGELRVLIKLAPHPAFRRSGRDLYAELPVSVVEACLGGEVDVPTLTGRVRMRLPPSSPGGRTLRLRGQGLPATSHLPAGDLHVTVAIEVPRSLTAAQRELLAQLGASLTPSQLPGRAALWAQLGHAAATAEPLSAREARATPAGSSQNE